MAPETVAVLAQVGYSQAQEVVQLQEDDVRRQCGISSELFIREVFKGQRGL